MENDRFLTTAGVSALTTLSRSTIERKVFSGEMPRPIYISQRRKAWKESAILAWMAAREAEAA